MVFRALPQRERRRLSCVAPARGSVVQRLGACGVAFSFFFFTENLPACIKNGLSSVEFSFAEALEDGSSDELVATLDDMIISFFEDLPVGMAAERAVQLLLVSSAPHDRRPSVVAAQWQAGAAGQLPGALLLPLARAVMEKDPALFHEISVHPAFQAAIKDDSGKGKEEAAVERTGLQLVEALEVCSAATEDTSDPIAQAVTYALTSGSLKEVLLVTLCLLHQEKPSESLVKSVSFLRQLSFLEHSKFMEQAMSDKMVKATIEQEDKIAQVVGISGVNTEVARKALSMVNWVPEQAINMLMDNPAQVEQALEKDVLEVESRAKQNDEKEKKRIEALKQGREKNLAAQISRKKCFVGSFVQLEDTEAAAGTPLNAASQSKIQALVRVMCHFDRLLVEMDSPLKLADAPLDKLHDGHILSVTFLGSLLERVVALLAETKFGSDGPESDEEKQIAYIVLVLVRMLRRTLSAFASTDESDQILYKRQKPATAKVLHSLSLLIQMVKLGKDEPEDEPLQSSAAVVPLTSPKEPAAAAAVVAVAPAAVAAAAVVADQRVADVVLAEAIGCFQAGFHALFATVADRKDLLDRVGANAAGEAALWNRLKRIVWKECSRDFVASIVEPATTEAMLMSLIQWEKAHFATLTADSARDVAAPRYALVLRLLFHLFHRAATTNTPDSNAKLLPQLTSVAVALLTHASESFAAVSLVDANASNMLRTISVGRLAPGVLLGLCCLEQAQLLQCLKLHGVLNKLLASLSNAISKGGSGWVVTLSEFAAHLLGELAGALVAGSAPEDLKVKPEATALLQLPLFLSGRVEEGQDVAVLPMMRKLCPWVLAKGRGINDLLKARVSPEIDEMIYTVAAAIVHHAGLESEMMALLSTDFASLAPPSWLEQAVRQAVALKLVAMKELQGSYSKAEEKKDGADEAPAATMASICGGYAARAKFLLQFLPCTASLPSTDERIKDITPHVVHFVTSTAATLEDVSLAMSLHDIHAAQRKTGFLVFREGLYQSASAESLRLQLLHHIKATFAGRDRFGVGVLDSLEICRQSVKAGVRAEFDALYKAIIVECKASLGTTNASSAVQRALVECLVFRADENDLPMLASSEVLRVLQRHLPVAREEAPDLQMSGVAFPLQDGAASKGVQALSKQELSATALKVLVLLVAQVVALSSKPRPLPHDSEEEKKKKAIAATTPLPPGASAAASLLIQDIEGVILSEFAQAVPVLARSSIVEHGDTQSDDCQQIISSVKHFQRDAEGMYVPELIRSVDSRPNVTFSLWLMLFPDSSQGAQGIFFTGQNGSQYRGLLINNRCLQYQHAAKNGMQAVVAPEPLPIGEWVHVAVTTRARRLRIYVGGKQVSENKMEAECFDITGFPLYVGTNFSAPQRSFSQGIDGLVSNFRFLPRYATAEEIKTLSQSGPILVRADDNAHQLAALVLRTHLLAPSIGAKISCDPYFSLVLEAIETGTLRVQRVLLRLLGQLLPQLEPNASIKFLKSKSLTMVQFLFGLAAQAKRPRQVSDKAQGRVNASSSTLSLLAETVSLLRLLLGNAKWASDVWAHVNASLEAGKGLVSAVGVSRSDSREYQDLVTSLYVVGGLVAMPRAGQKVVAVVATCDHRVGVLNELNPWASNATVRLENPEKANSFFHSTLNAESVRSFDPDNARGVEHVPEQVFAQIVGLLSTVMHNPLFVETEKERKDREEKELAERNKPVAAAAAEEKPLSEEEQKLKNEVARVERNRENLQRFEFQHLCATALRVMRGLPHVMSTLANDPTLFRLFLKVALEETWCNNPDTLDDVEHETLMHERRVIDMLWCKKDSPAPPAPVEESDEDGSGASAPPPPAAPGKQPNKKKEAVKKAVPANADAFAGFSFQPAKQEAQPVPVGDDGGGMLGLFDDDPPGDNAGGNWGDAAPAAGGGGNWGDAAPPVPGGLVFGGGLAANREGQVFLGGNPPPPQGGIFGNIVPGVGFGQAGNAADPAVEAVLAVPAQNVAAAAAAEAAKVIDAAAAAAGAPAGGAVVAPPPPPPAAEVKKGPTKEQKMEQLRQQVPAARERDVVIAMALNKDDVAKSAAWLKDCVQKRLVAEVADALGRIYPESWCSFALGKCGNSVKDAVAWLPLHIKDVVESEADMMDMFSGEDAFRHRYFVDKPAPGSNFNNNGPAFGRGGGLFDWGGGGGIQGSAYSKLLRCTYERVIDQLLCNTEACIILSCRKLLLLCLAKQDSEQLVTLVQARIPPTHLCRLMRYSLFRGPELVLENINDAKALFENVLKLIWHPVSSFPASYRTCLTDTVVLQLYKLPNPEYAGNLSMDRGDRFTSDSVVATTPSMPFVEWILGHMFGSPFLQAEQIGKIFGGLIASVRCGHMFVKASVFAMISNLLRRALVDPSIDVSMYLSALPVEKLMNHAKTRLAVERTVESRGTRTRYLSTLLELVVTLQYFLNVGKKERSTVRAPEIIPLHFASTATSVTLAWLAMHKPKVEQNLFRKKSDVMYRVEMRESTSAEWRVIYEGSSMSVTRENLLPLTCYAFRLQARRGDNQSDWSSVAYACTMGNGVQLAVNRRGDGLQVDDNNRTVTKLDQAQAWRVVTGTQTFVSGLHYWEVFVEASEWGTVALGVAPSKKVSLTNATGFCFANFRGLIGSNESLFGEFYGGGDTVGILLDMDQKNLSFFKNRKPLGTAFSNMKVEDALPIFCLKNAGSKVTLMPESYSRAGFPVECELNNLVDVGQVLFGLCSAGRVLPRFFVRRAFNNWKVWSKQTVQRHVTRAGFEIEINVSDSKLAPWGFKYGDRVSSPEGERIILGVNGGLLWHRPVKNIDNHGVWFWSQKFIEEWKSEINVLEKGAAMPQEVNADLPFYKFEEQMAIGWTMEQDEAICRAFDRAAQSLDMDPQNVTMSRFLKEMDLGGMKPEAISARAAVMRELNESISGLLITAAFEERDEPWSLGGLVSRLRMLLFLHVKENAFRWLLEHTTQLTNLRDDEYTDPSNLMTIAVNREKAQRYAEDADPDKRKRSSLFFQMQERLRQMGVNKRGQGATANLRQVRMFF